MIPIEVRSKADCTEQEVRQFTERRVRFALDRFRQTRRVAVFIEDVNGPKGGADKRCRIVAEFGFASVVIEEVRPAWQSAVARAVRRLSRKLAQELKRVNRSHVHVSRRTEVGVAPQNRVSAH